MSRGKKTVCACSMVCCAPDARTWGGPAPSTTRGCAGHHRGDGASCSHALRPAQANAKPQEGDCQVGRIPTRSQPGVSSPNWELPALGAAPQGCTLGDAPHLPCKDPHGCPYPPVPTSRFPNFPSSGTS